MLKIVAAVAVGGLAFWALEKYAIKGGSQGGMLFGQFAFEADDAGAPKLSLGYIVMGGAIVLAAVGVGMAVHKVSGGRIPAGVTLAK